MARKAGDGTECGARGAPEAGRGGSVSESVAKALRGGIGREEKREIPTILFRCSGAIRAFATDLDKRRRRGPLHGRRPRRSPRSRAAPPPGGRTRPRAPRCALCTRTGTFNRTSRVQNAPLESIMHISTITGPTHPSPPRTASVHTILRRPRPTDHDPWRERLNEPFSSGFVLECDDVGRGAGAGRYAPAAFPGRRITPPAGPPAPARSARVRGETGRANGAEGASGVATPCTAMTAGPSAPASTTPLSLCYAP